MLPVWCGTRKTIKSNRKDSAGERGRTLPSTSQSTPFSISLYGNESESSSSPATTHKEAHVSVSHHSRGEKKSQHNSLENTRRPHEKKNPRADLPIRAQKKHDLSSPATRNRPPEPGTATAEQIRPAHGGGGDDSLIPTLPRPPKGGKKKKRVNFGTQEQGGARTGEQILVDQHGAASRGEP